MGGWEGRVGGQVVCLCHASQPATALAVSTGWGMLMQTMQLSLQEHPQLTGAPR